MDYKDKKMPPAFGKQKDKSAGMGKSRKSGGLMRKGATIKAMGHSKAAKH
jgi:hypothetical protein